MLTPEIQDKYFGIFPTMLFQYNFFKDSMHFVMSLKHTTYEDTRELITLMLHCGATISFDIKEASDYSILLVDHNDVIPFPGPAFTVNYVKECLDSLKIKDIDLYRQEATKHIASGVKCMSVVYFRSFKWKDVLKTEEIQWLCPNSNVHQDLDDPFKKNNHRIMSSTAIEEGHSDCESDSETAGERSSDTDVEKIVETFKSLHSKNNIRPGASKINTNKNSNLNNKRVVHVIGSIPPNSEKSWVLNNGDSVSSGSSQSNCPKPPTAVEKKNHTSKLRRAKPINSESSDTDVDEILELTHKQLKKVNPVASNENTISKKTNANKNVNIDKQKQRRMNTNTKQTEICSSSSSVKSATSTSKWNFLDEFESDKSEDECTNSNKGNFLDDFEADRNREPPPKLSKRSRKPYTKEERNLILKYIVDRNEFSRVKGKELWVIMERKKICPSRTWQSMKEHFLKKIILDLEAYPFLSNEAKRKLRTACF